MPGACGLFSNVPNLRVLKFCSSACMKFYGQGSIVETDVTRPEDGVPASRYKSLQGSIKQKSLKY